MDAILRKKQALQAISIVKSLNENYHAEKNKKPLLDSESENPVFLQITLQKIPPRKARQKITIHLPHSLVTDTTEVCLFTGDLEKSNKKAEIDPVVLHYKELLKSQDVTNINEVIPLRQLRTEYKTFEAKRHLLGAYDVFIADNKIAGCLPKLLGKFFFKKRKFPFKINMQSKNLKAQVEKALSNTVCFLSCLGNSCTTQVAHLGMEDSKIFDNIKAAVDVLIPKIPGAVENILGIYIKTAKSKAVPIYISSGNPNSVEITIPKKKVKVEEEELSTLPNTKVKVFKSGKIIVKKCPSESASEDESQDKNEQCPGKRKKLAVHPSKKVKSSDVEHSPSEDQ